ncbi:MAG: hypothetical protein MJ250_07670 [Alphaproteobacteria bacterium]|nr:hypothetical protein [Alphaproteobacteria bacterium]
MKIKCKNCGNIEETSVGFFVKLIGGALPVGGFWAWVTYFFAGTGLALPICTAMVVGGVGMLMYKEKIIHWIIEKGYKCPKCNHADFDMEK